MITRFGIWEYWRSWTKLKGEKKEINKKLKIAEGCVEEYKKFSMLDFSTIEDEIRNSIEVPEYPYAEKKDIALSVNESVSDMGMDDISVMNESEDYETSLGAEYMSRFQQKIPWMPQ